MQITSNGFLLFILGTALLYRLIPARLRWMALLAASLCFYGFGGWEYLLYLLFSIGVTFFGALALEKQKSRTGKKGLLALSLFLNLGMLGVLKYAGFFLENLNRVLGGSLPGASFLLPLGISFYVFQTTGYLIDVYRGREKAEKNPAKYALFAAYFPQMIQGPIGRWERLAPQLFAGKPASWEDITQGIGRMVWGYFKTLVIAGQAAVFADAVFAAPGDYPGLALPAVLLYSLQLYANFSGGIDVVLGVSRLFGIRLDENFCQPYFAVSIGDFWRRWHMTLSSWLKDYVYIPLGGSRKGRMRTYVNLLLTFLISGLWHGAAWTFLVWGLIHGLYQVIGRATKGFREAGYRRLGLSGGLLQIGGTFTTFCLVSFAWIFFRAESLAGAWEMVLGLFCRPDAALLLSIPAGREGLAGTPLALGAVIFGAFLLFFFDFAKERAESLGREWMIPGPVRFLSVLLLLAAVGALGSTALARGFIYAQF